MSDLALDRFRRLARNGLSVEQILLASGLLNKKQYLTLLEIASSLPLAPHAVEPLTMEGFSRANMRKYQAIPFEHKESRVYVAFSRPMSPNILAVRDVFAKEGIRVIPYVMTEGAFKRVLHERQRRSTHNVVHTLLSLVELQGLTHVRLLEDETGVHVMTDTYHPVAEALLYAKELAACILFLKRKKSELGWAISDEHHGLTRAFHLVREQSGAHPLDWIFSSDDVLDGDGLTVLIQPDAFLEPKVKRIPQFTHFSDWSKSQRKYITGTTQEKEMAQHAALAGERVLALSVDGEDWWSDIASSGVPVKVLKSHITPKGRAWEVFTA